MKIILVCLSILTMFNCKNRGIHVPTTEEPIIPMIANREQYEKDKKQIEICHRANSKYQKLPQNQDRTRNSGIGLFEDYPNEVLGIYYSADLLKAVIFTSISTQNWYKDNPDKFYYNITAKIGLRKSVDEGFTIYPNRMAGQGGDDKALAFKRIKLYWYHTLHKNKNLNLGGKDFWEKNDLFKRVKLTDTGEEFYRFQTYKLSSLGNKNYYDTHFLHNVLDCSGEIDLNKNNGSKGTDLEFIQEERERKDR